MRSILSGRIGAMALCGLFCLGIRHADAACLDLKRDARLSFEGSLYFQVFGGPPYNGGVNKGDTPEPTYILKLDHPVCVEGNDLSDAIDKADEVQVFAADANQATLFESMRRLAGRKVRVECKSAFTAHTGHHHAPLLLPIATIVETSDPSEAESGAMAAVQGFYLALAEGDGKQAAGFLVPGKRASGPLSASAMSRFYGDLDEMLAFREVRRTGPDEFRVAYDYVSRGGHRCDGTAIVGVKGEDLISSIKPLNGC